MRKSTCSPLMLAFACVLAISCQTTPPSATKPQQTAQSQQPTAQGQQSAAAPTSPTTGQAQSTSEQPQPAQPQGQGPNLARNAARSIVVGPPGKLVRAVSAEMNNLLHKVQYLVKRPGTRRTGGAVEKLTSWVRGFRTPPEDLIVAVVAAVILVGGGTMTLAARRAGRRRS